MFRDTLSTTEEWFEIWLRHFDKAGAGGFWPGKKKEQDFRIPFIKKTLSVGGLKIPAAWGAVNAHTPRYDILGSSARPLDKALLQMMQDLGVAMLQFPYLSPDSRLIKELESTDLLTLHVEPCEVAPYISTTGSWDDYWAGRGKSRREWGRRERRLMGREEVRFSCLTDWDTVAPLWQEILEIESSGWKGRSGTAIIQNPETLGFYTHLAQWWSREGCLRLYVLYEDETPIAFELDAKYNGILHCFKHGYLESHAKQGPGQVLRMQILREAFSDPETEYFDMFGPDTEAKRKWATGAEQLQTLKVFCPSPLGKLAWLRFSVAPRIKARLRRPG